MNHGLLALVFVALAGCVIVATRHETQRRGLSIRLSDRIVYALHLATRWMGCIAHGADMGLLAFRRLKARTPIVLECQQEEQLWSSESA